MDHYVDITMRPDTEMTAASVLEVVFKRFHLYLVESGAELAVSFPEHHKAGMGSIMRVHGAADALVAFKAAGLGKGLSGLIDVTDVLLAPQDARHCQVTRQRRQANAERARRRAEKRGNLTPEQIEKMFTPDQERKFDTPFIRYQSGSNGHYTAFNIHHGIIDAPCAGGFNAFGLSKGGSVPLF